MPKQIEDITPPERKSIRDIPIPENRRKNLNLIDATTSNSNFEPLKEVPREEPTIPRERRPVTDINFTPQEPFFQPKKAFEPEQNIVSPVKEPVFSRMDVPQHKDFYPVGLRRKLPNKTILIACTVGIIILALGIFSLFSSASITYIPKTQALSFSNEKISATKEGQPGDLLFSVIKISDEKSAEAPASGEEQVNQRASGVIIVYNNSGITPQRLIKNTRFETPNGKIYRIQNDISVPGQKLVSGAMQPGSLEVTVYADQPGEAYNIGLSDFTLPGLKGDSKFTTIYGRSKSSIAGGMIGTVKKVSDDDKTSAEVTLKSSLKDALLAEATAQVPKEFILLPELTDVTFEPLGLGTSTSDKATIKERGNFSGIIFKKADLLHYLASKKTTLGPTETVDANLENLQTTFATKPTADLATLNKIDLNITGDAKVVWISNEDNLKKDLSGKSKSQLAEVLKNYSSILSASAVVRPFWKSSFPTDETKIKLIKEIKQ